MFSYVIYCFGIFFIVLDVIMLLYLLRHVFGFSKILVYIIDILAAPMLIPMQKLVKKSILNCFNVDISPYIILMVLMYLYEICQYILNGS